MIRVRSDNCQDPGRSDAELELLVYQAAPDNALLLELWVRLEQTIAEVEQRDEEIERFREGDSPELATKLKISEDLVAELERKNKNFEALCVQRRETFTEAIKKLQGEVAELKKTLRDRPDSW